MAWPRWVTRSAFGEYGLKATTRGFVTARQIEAARRAITRYVKRGGKLMDPRLSGQADYQETGRGSYG